MSIQGFTPVDPQSFNRYGYVQNNPLKFIDPSGQELVILGEDAEYIKGELERLTGYKLNRDAKTGVVTIDGRSKETTGTSKSLADKLKAVIDLKDTNGDKVTVDIHVVRDTDSDGKSVFIDRFSTRSIDANDFREIGKSNPEFSAAQLGHVLEEYAQAATTFKELAGIGKTQELASHNVALDAESQIMSDFTKQQEGRRRDFQGKTFVTFFYTSVQYDIQTKSGTQIVGITKKERKAR